MPISPKPSDYVSQVRGFLNDLRQDAQQNAQLGLQYAQLSQQRANAERQFALQQQQLELSEIQNLRALESDQYNRQRQAFADAIAGSRLQLDQEKQYLDLKQKNEKEQQEKSAASLENEFRLAMESNDPNKISAVLNKIGEANLDAQMRTQIQANTYAALEKKKQFEQTQKNLDTMGTARSTIAQLASLDPQTMTPSQYSAKVLELTNQYNNLNNTDSKILTEFFNAQQQANNNLTKFSQTRRGNLVDSFMALGEYKDLEPEWQKAYEELKAKPESMTRAALEGLARKRNRQKSIAQLQAIDESNIRRVEEVRKNPEAQGRDFAGVLPDLSPVEAEGGNIDPLTGELTPEFITAQRDFERQIRSPSFVLGRPLTMQQALTQNIMPPAKLPVSATGQGPQQEPIRSPSRFDTAQAGPKAVLPVAPASPGISPETISEVIAAYNTNPDGIYKGRSVREIVARLQALGVSLPGLRVQTVAGGQEQRR